MSNSIDAPIDDLINGISDNFGSAFSPLDEGLLEQYSETLITDPEFANFINTFNSSDINSQPGYSPENNSNHQELTNLIAEAVILPNNMQINPGQIQIMAQPYYGTKLRYRSDYDKNENRLGVLKNRTKDSSFQGPAICIPQEYRNPNGEYFVRVTLVTSEYSETGLHYFHPYEIEHPINENMNDRKNNSVWFCIQHEDCITGNKSFPSLRIVKKRASDLKAFGNLYVFDCHDPNLHNNFLQQLSSQKDTINKYNLEKSQLAFTIGMKIPNSDQVAIQPYTTVYSEEMIEGVGKDSEGDYDTTSPNEKSNLSPTICRVYKYAPRYGYSESQEDMVIFLTNKLEPKKYGELKVTFECNTSNGLWSQSVVEIDIKDRMVSFKTPMYQDSFDVAQSVDIILQQDNRTIDTIKYYYLATLGSCSKCQSNTVRIQTNAIPNISNKRATSRLIDTNYYERDVVEFKPSLSVPVQEPSQPSVSTSTNTSLPLIQSPQTTVDPSQILMDKLTDTFKSLFVNDDYKPFFRLSRAFLKKSPEIVHNAIINNNFDILLKLIPTASIDILQLKNQSGETIFLHALRLNRMEIIKILLENKHIETLLNDTDANKNNIFHLIALNSISFEIISLLINYFVKNSINIREKFDFINQDSLTPLQLSIRKNNLLITKIFCKYFDTKIHQTKNLTGDNLIHLAVRFADLIMIKYLIEDEGLFEQGKQFNLKMTPNDLAKSLKHDDIIEYFNKIYPEQNIQDDENSDDDDD